mmetsp:Transcript_10982/g.31018  ORF Transcript_10982/g.31018 Transcript_10982/m.31018 type:complete len:332 (-) Transcript_10982:538-1533(-)
MCGRTRVSLNEQQLLTAVGGRQVQWVDRERYRPSSNVSPGTRAPVITVTSTGTWQLQTMTWGLIPSFFKRPGDGSLDHYQMMNARVETVQQKPAFSRLVMRCRCLVPVNGFYEWRTEVGIKQPYYTTVGGEDDIMLLAGLYDCWTGDGSEEPLYTFTILTTDSSDRLKWLHDRMPVVLPTRDAQERWLCGSASSVSDILPTCISYNGADLLSYPVNPAMSKPSYQEEDAHQELKRRSVMSLLTAKPKSSPTKVSVLGNAAGTDAQPARDARTPESLAGHEAGFAGTPVSVETRITGGMLCMHGSMRPSPRCASTGCCSRCQTPCRRALSCH